MARTWVLNTKVSKDYSCFILNTVYDMYKQRIFKSRECLKMKAEHWLEFWYDHTYFNVTLLSFSMGFNSGLKRAKTTYILLSSVGTVTLTNNKPLYFLKDWYFCELTVFLTALICSVLVKPGLHCNGIYQWTPGKSNIV